MGRDQQLEEIREGLLDLLARVNAMTGITPLPASLPMTRVKRIRIERGYTQTEVASKSKIARGAYRNIENGSVSPNVRTLHKIAEALGCRVAELIRG